jgi:hypothetical protein
MRKFLPIILTVLLLSACNPGLPENTEPLPPETFVNTTLTTAANGEREEIANTENDEIGETFPVLDGVIRELTSDDYVVYYTDKTLGNSRLNEIVAYDRKTGEMIDVFASQLNLSVKPSDEYFTGQTFLTDDFYFGEDGLLYLTMLTDYNTDGFHKKLFYSKDLKTLQSAELGSETSDTPYPEYMPEKGITKTLQLGNYIIYRYEYTEEGERYEHNEEGKPYNFIVSGIGYIDTTDMSRHTVMELRNRDPESYTDPMDAGLESNPPELIPDGFAVYDNKLYYYIYSNWSDENWAWLRDLPADDGWHMRTYYEYNFETLTNNFGMWQDSELPLPLKPEFTDPPSKAFDSPAASYESYAYDGEYVYYKNADDNGNLYKKIPNSDGAGVKLADANEHGYLYGICVYGDEVFYATHYFDDNTPDGTDGHGGPTVYAVKKDGSSTAPKVVLEGAGDYFYVYDGVFYFTGGEYSKYDGLNSLPYDPDSDKPLDGAQRKNIAPFAMDVVIVNDQITYFDGEKVVIYEID